ncbi:LCP family protein [Streptomyces specialis]|uniref:LCP family protein n=1 Tax=Streptomyces specialis TaxID=498367 RepID=UPI00073E1B77|nr:LCP family protein [Streptomyces specialis]
MNDRQDPYGHIYGYDEYGRPLYAPVPPQPHARRDEQDQHPDQQDQQDQYPAGDQYPEQGQGGPDAYQDYGYGGGAYAPGSPETYPGQQYGHAYGTAPQPPATDVRPGYGYDHDTAAPPAGGPEAEPASVPPQRQPPDDGYQTEQFAFVDDQDEESTDVIDWLKFTESRTERREEAKRRGRNRRRLLVVALVLALLGCTGYLWATDRLPFTGSDDGDGASAGAQERDVIVVPLVPTDSEESSTVLLVANDTTSAGTTLLLPNELAVTPDNGPTTLGQAVADEAAGSVREALGGLLGADITGTWRLDTPYLENLVLMVGGITLTTDTEITAEEAGEDGEGGGEGPLVPLGENVQLDGRAAVAYATHRADDEPQDAQLARFGQVMRAVLEKMPDSESAAVRIVENLFMTADPSLTEQELGATLARLAGYARAGDYATEPLPVEEGGTIGDETAEGLLADVLGGTADDAAPGAAPRVGIRDAGAGEAAAETARVTLLNGGFSVIDSRAVDDVSAETSVSYADETFREAAIDVARTLGLPEEAVVQGESPGTADVTIILGQDAGA